MNKATVTFRSRGPSGNIYWIIGEAGNALKKQRRIADYNTMRDRVFASGSYAEALEIIREYVDLVDLDGLE